MNKGNIRRVALALLTGELATRKRGLKVGYNQSGYKTMTRPDNSGHMCNTTACIAGTAVAIFKPEFFRANNVSAGKMFDIGQKAFGINVGTADALFSGSPRGVLSPSAKQAAMVLFHLAETGKVNWEVTI